MIRVDVITSDSRFTVCEQGLQGYEIVECKVTVQLNAVSSAVIKVPPTNTHIQPLTSGISPVIAIYDNERLEFIGSIASHKTDLWGNVEIQLDGALSWLSDIVKPPFYVDNKSHAEYIDAIIGQYNNAMVANGTEERIIEFGGVVGFSGLVDIHHSDEYVNTLDLLREAVEMYGGYFFETFGDGVAHPAVGWIREPIVDSGVVIEFGVNELALESQLDFSDFATRVYAVGKTSNITYLASAPDLELEYGRRDYAIKTDAEDQNTLAVQANAVLNARKIPVRIIEVTAAELGLMGQRADALEIGSTATLLDRKLGDDVVLMVNTIERDLIDRQNTRISLGRSPVTITGVVSSGGSSSSVQSSGGGVISIPDAVLFTPQNLTPNQQAIARNNIGVGSGGEAVVDAVLYTPQTLTEAQQAQARENIGVTASDSDLPEPTDADNGKVLGIRNGQYTLVDDQTGDDSTFPEDTEIDLSKVAWEIGAFNANGKNFDVGDAAVVSEFATTSYTTIQSGKIRIALASSSTIPSGYTPNVTITKPGGGTYDLSGVVWEYGSIGRGGQNLNGVTDRIRTKDSIDVEAGSVVSCSAFSTYNEGMRVVELNMDLFRRVRTIGFIKAPARTVISCSDFTLCEKGLRVCEYAAPDLSLAADVVSSIAPRNYRVTKSCYIRILLASDTIRYDLPLDTGSQYDGQMMTSVASEIVHAMIPAQTVRPSNAYTRRTGIPRIILPWSGYELLTTTTADAELPSTNKLSTIYGKWDALMAQYPGYIEKETVGYGEKPSGDSNEYPIYAYTLRSYIPTPDNPDRNPNSQFKFTYDKPQKNLEVIWIGTIHAHEHTVPVDDFKFFSELMKRNTEVTDLLMQNCNFTVVPIMNPYGYEHFNEILNDVPNAGVRCGRVNANGVNLNRNFPEQWQYIEPFVEGEPNNDYAGAEAASESEVQAVMAFLTAHSDAFICVNRHTSAEFAPTSVLAYFASIIEEDTKIAFNACRFMNAQMHHSDLYANYIGTVKASDFDKVQDTDSRCLYTVQKSETPGTMDKWYNAVLGLDGFLFEMSPNDHNYANSPWGREVWQRINVTGICNMLYSVMLQNEYIPKG